MVECCLSTLIHRFLPSLCGGVTALLPPSRKTGVLFFEDKIEGLWTGMCQEQCENQANVVNTDLLNVEPPVLFLPRFLAQY